MVVRKHPRFRASFSGTVVHHKQCHVISKSLDLSRKGCRVQSTLPAFAGMKVDLQLYLPDTQTPIRIQGAIVRWAGQHGIGIEFPALASPFDQQRLDGMIQRLETGAAIATPQKQVTARA